MKVKFLTLFLICFFQSFSQSSSFFKDANKHFKEEFIKTDEKGWIKFKEDNKLSKGQAFKKYKEAKKSIDEFKEISSKKDNNGNEHIRYQQYYKGILVECGTIIEHFRGGKLKILNGVYLEGINTDVVPKKSKNDAIGIALSEFGDIKFIWQDSIAELELKKDSENENATHYPKPDLVIDCNKNLVWRFSVITDVDNFEYRINALTGKIESKMSKVLNCGLDHKPDHFKSNNLNHANDIEIFPENRFIYTYPTKEEKILSDLTTYGHTLFSGIQPIRTTFSGCWLCASKHRLIAHFGSTIIETRDHEMSSNLSQWRREVTMNGISNTTWPIAEQLHTQSHWAVTRSYEYFRDVHNYYVGAGNGTIRVKSNVNDPNARYLGDNRSLTFGFLNGNYLGLIDVAGHEFTHLMIHAQNGLGQQTANMEPNSLNESFADILGTMVERQYRPGGWDWLLSGESITLRNLLNPSLSPWLNGPLGPFGGPQPEIYQGVNWTFSQGPHINGGVQNKWFTLLALGGTHNGITVQGVGIDNAARIVMQNLNVYIQPLSNYNDACNGAVESAIDLFGNCSFIHQQTERAWLACGLGALTSCFTGGGNENFKVIAKINKFSDLVIFPNPANETITINSSEKIASYTIFDISGIVKGKFILNDNQINISSLNNGVYIIELKTQENETIHRKFIKTN